VQASRRRKRCEQRQAAEQREASWTTRREGQAAAQTKAQNEQNEQREAGEGAAAGWLAGKHWLFFVCIVGVVLKTPWGEGSEKGAKGASVERGASAMKITLPLLRLR